MTSPEILQLLLQCSGDGIYVSESNNSLVIKSTKNKTIDQNLLGKLKHNKQQIIDHFQMVKLHTPGQGTEAPFELHDNRKYYSITPTETYWIDDKIDSDYKSKDKVHGSCFLIYKIHGELDHQALKKAFRNIVRRHESLRATFHILHDTFFMRIEDENSPEYELEIVDDTQSRQEEDLNVREHFPDHKFHIGSPTILGRLTAIRPQTYLLAIKINHVIADSWSLDVIEKELFASYQAITQNLNPVLTPIKRHLKDFMAMENEHRTKSFDNHKRYWNALYANTPNELIIPIKTKCPPAESQRLLNTEVFEISQLASETIATLAKHNAVSLFQIIQSSFYAFMYSKTRQNDIVIGSSIFGRDHVDTHHLVGCFAKTVLIRTIFNGDAPFNEIVKAVKKSNDDMREYDTYTLKDAFKEMIPQGASMFGSFWKINLEFHEVAVPQSNGKSDEPVRNKLQIEPIKNITNSHIQIDMYLQFIRSNSKLKLKVAFDSSLYELADMRAFINEYLLFIQKLH